jgi:aspartate aminotransferase
MNLRFSDRINRIEPSGTVQLTDTLEDLRTRGVDVIDMAVGEPDFAVNPEIIAATAAALEEGLTRYGPVGGLPALRKRIAAHFEGCEAEHVIVTNGAKQALYSLFQVICPNGAEIIIPTPCWVSFSHQVKLAGGRPVLVPTVAHQPDLDAIAQAIGPQTAALLINSPNNPTGAVYSPELIGALGELCCRHDLWLISDEAYRDFNFSGAEPFSPFEIPRLRERLITVRSFSKTYGMTGFRIGFAVAPSRVIQALQRLQSHLSGNVCTFAQYGALAALELPNEILNERRRQYARRRDRAFHLISELFDCQKPQGAFYLLPTIARYADRFASGTALAEFLLEQAHVAVVPGEHFFASGHVRISFATSGDRMEEGLRRMCKVLTS